MVNTCGPDLPAILHAVIRNWFKIGAGNLYGWKGPVRGISPFKM